MGYDGRVWVKSHLVRPLANAPIVSEVSEMPKCSICC